jgi:phosphatidylinositol 4-kinase B
VANAMSLDALKKTLPPERTSLYDYFSLNMGKPGSSAFRQAQKEFMHSLAGYSLACYILQVKDRHNGNILIDTQGHVVHIDFGFILSNSPGGNINFESAPFKLTEEFEKILGGRRSRLFAKFRGECVKGYKALRQKAEQIIMMVDMVRTGAGQSLPCFVAGDEAISGLRKRLLPEKNMNHAACKKYINSLIDESLDHWSTRCYDKFQYCCQGILY